MRIREYWGWLAAALFVLLSLDLLTTVYAAAVVGIDAEANPLVRWALAEGLLVLVAVNLAAALLVVVLFYGLVELLETAREPLDAIIARGIELWLGLLLAAGLFVFANNLSVILLGRSLL